MKLEAFIRGLAPRSLSASGLHKHSPTLRASYSDLGLVEDGTRNNELGEFNWVLEEGG